MDINKTHDPWDKYWPPQVGDIWRDTALGVTWHARADDDGQPEFYEPGGPGLIPARAVLQYVGCVRLLERDGKAVA